MAKKHDLTAQCRADLGAGLKVDDLRHRFCVICRQPKCGHAKFGDSEWLQRMLTQEERLLNNPRKAPPNDPLWEMVSKMNFEDMMRQAIRMEIADRRGDWQVPDLSSDTLPSLVTSQTPPQPVQVDHRQETLSEKTSKSEEKVTSVRVRSRTSNKVYTVTLNEEGIAVSCTCRAGKYDNDCWHRKAAEAQILQPEEREAVASRLLKRDPEEEINPAPQPPDQIERVLPRAQNIPIPAEGIMVGGGPVPAYDPDQGRQTRDSREGIRQKVQAAWGSSTVRTVKPGATIKLGVKKRDG